MVVYGPYKWTHRRRVLLDDLAARGYTDKRIARELGMTKTAVSRVRERYGIRPAYRQGYSRQALAALLGVSKASIEKWRRDGRLNLRQNGAKSYGSRCWMTTHAELMAFLSNPDNWHCWRVEDVTDSDLRAWAERLRGDVVYLTCKEAAAMLGCTLQNVWYLIDRGTLPGRRDGGRVYVDRRDVERYGRRRG